MASLTNSRTLFAFTSPRTLEKSIPEIQLLIENFSGKVWDSESQIRFYELLTHSDFFEGGVPQQIKDGMAGRDRINRAPQMLGFVTLKPTISLTLAGKMLLLGKRTQEVITRQLMKFQLPSPYHTQSKDESVVYCVKPYLELLRLIRDMDGLSKYEIGTFFLQMIHYEMYDNIKSQIQDFREYAKDNRGLINRKQIESDFRKNVIHSIWKDDIKLKNIRTRENHGEVTLDKFYQTKSQTMNDYADAFFRYLRASGLVTLNRGYRIIVSPTMSEEVDYLLTNINRIPLEYKKLEYIEYLGATDNLMLLSDNKSLIVTKLKKLGAEIHQELDIEDLKDKLELTYSKIKEERNSKEQEQLRTYSEFDDIIEMYNQIREKRVIDAPLMMEYNTWRAMTMINHARRIDGNFQMDIDLNPICTASGGKSDIEAEYTDFGLIIEVTLSSGAKQYDMEGEPVARHYGMAKQNINSNMYCIFIANTINENTLGHFYNTNRFSTKIYGGKTKIIPLNLNDFLLFLKTAKDNGFNDPNQLKNWLERMWQIGQNFDQTEDEWYNHISASIPNWTNAV